MNDLNTVILIGNIVEKPQCKYSQSNMAIANLRIANNVYSKTEQDNKKTNFFTITVFGKLAENCEKWLDKGSKIAVSGKLDYSSWEKDGQKKSMVKIVADNVQFLNNKN